MVIECKLLRDSLLHTAQTRVHPRMWGVEIGALCGSPPRLGLSRPLGGSRPPLAQRSDIELSRRTGPPPIAAKYSGRSTATRPGYRVYCTAMDYAVFSDESRHTEGRYRSLAAVSLAAGEVVALTELLRSALQLDSYGELKWKNLRRAGSRDRAIAAVDVLFAHIASGVHVDVLTWDTHDSRHNVPNRDDVANYERMFFHLHRVLMERRGAQSRWHIRPDEQVNIDWDTIRQCLTRDGTWRTGHNIATLSAEFRHFVPSVLTFREVNSAETPLCQLADLLAGMAAYTRTNADVVRRQINEPTEQGSLFGSDDQATPGTADRHRFRLISHLYCECKARKLGVSLREFGYLRTHDPAMPINFWHYEPQHHRDKAPTREASVRKGGIEVSVY